MIIGQAGDSHLATDSAALRQNMRKRDSARSFGHSVGADTIQIGFGVEPGNVIFSKACQVQNTDTLANRKALIAHDIEHVIAPVAVIFLAAIE